LWAGFVTNVSDTVCIDLPSTGDPIECALNLTFENVVQEYNNPTEYDGTLGLGRIVGDDEDSLDKSYVMQISEQHGVLPRVIFMFKTVLFKHSIVFFGDWEFPDLHSIYQNSTYLPD